MNFKLLGCTLMVAGTSIGAGLLALPVATAESGFINTTITLLFCWAFMTMGAFYILEVNLKLPEESNLITMAKASLGKPGEFVTWGAYLLLLYALLSAYIAGGSDIAHLLLQDSHFIQSKWLDTLIFTAIFGSIVISGVRTVDWTNRGLMIVKLGTFFLLLVVITPHITHRHLAVSHLHAVLPALMVVITSFGFAVIIPSLRIYLKSDVKQLRLSIALGSLIAFFCYWLWCLSVQGNIPLNGADGLRAIGQSSSPVMGLTTTLSNILNKPGVTFAVHLFASISVLTSFLAVALSLSDFLSDGLRTHKQGHAAIKVYALTFIPPIAVVLFFPDAFIHALAFAGVFCVILLILLPALMAYQMREKHQGNIAFETPGGSLSIKLTIAVALILLIVGIFTL